ncbi:MAG: retron Ec48 family effector membrane protein [Acinetobacter venetianus]|uniref:retron Ec48 family effector membrane protein n=1 Tax=Acinetobacter venetianus TaxID=52133 RepID=UPI003C7289D2
MDKLARNSFLINKVIKIVWFVAACSTLYFFSCNFFFILREGYQFQPSSNGLGIFYDLNNYIFQIPIFAAAITTALLGWITVQIYLETYLTTHTNNLNTQKVNQYSTYLQHYKNFLETIDIYLEQSNYLRSDSIDRLFFYRIIYPNSFDGDLNISEKYKEILYMIDSNIKFLNEDLPRKVGYSEHIKRLIDHAKKLGISIQECDRKDFIKLEYDFYLFINNINKSLVINELTRPEY